MKRRATPSSPPRAIGPLHAPGEREVLMSSPCGRWQVRRFGMDEGMLEFAGRHGILHLQLWAPEVEVSVLTPSLMTGGAFELFGFRDRESVRAPLYADLRARVWSRHGLAAPEARLVTGWLALYVDRTIAELSDPPILPDC